MTDNGVSHHSSAVIVPQLKNKHLKIIERINTMQTCFLSSGTGTIDDFLHTKAIEYYCSNFFFFFDFC